MRKKLIQVAVEVLLKVSLNLCSSSFLLFKGDIEGSELIRDGRVEVGLSRSLGRSEDILDVSLLGLECLPGGRVGCRNFVNLIGHELIILTYSFINK